MIPSGNITDMKKYLAILTMLSSISILSGCKTNQVKSQTVEKRAEISSEPVSFMGFTIGQKLTNDFIKKYNYEKFNDPMSVLLSTYSTESENASTKSDLLYSGHIHLSSSFSDAYPEIAYAYFRVHPDTRQLTSIELDTTGQFSPAKGYLNCVKLKNNLLNLFYAKYGGAVKNEINSNESADRNGAKRSSNGSLNVGKVAIDAKCSWYVSNRSDIATGRITISIPSLEDERTLLIEKLRKRQKQRANERYKSLM